MQVHDNPIDKGCDNQVTILPTNPKDCILSVCGKLISRTKTKEQEGKENNFFLQNGAIVNYLKIQKAIRHVWL